MSEKPPDAPLTELTRRLFVSLNAGDINAFIGALGPNAVFDVSSWGLGTYVGERAIRRFLEDWTGSFDRYERHAEEIVDRGNGIVFAAATTRAMPAGGRAEIRLPGAYVLVWVEDKLERVTNYRDTTEARAAAENLAESVGR